MSQPIRLIINADDLGAGEPTDRGIIEAFTKGVVSSASLLANGPSFDSATRLARTTKLPIGVHLNLSEGPSLTGPIDGLTDSHDCFLGKELSRQRFRSGELNIETVKNEMVAQINTVRQAGINPDHLDTHQHCGLFPPVTTALLQAAREVNIDRLRLPLPVRPASADPPAPLGNEIQLYRQLAPVMAAELSKAGMVAPEGLLGMPLLNHLNETNLAQLLTDLQPGIWELMVHPGYFDPQREFAGSEREKELTALTSGAIRTLIKNRQIELIDFTELPCAC